MALSTGNGGVLELTAGSGSIGLIGSSAFSGFETLSDDGSALWTLTGEAIQSPTSPTTAGSPSPDRSIVSAAVGAASTGQFDLQNRQLAGSRRCRYRRPFPSRLSRRQPAGRLSRRHCSEQALADRRRRDRCLYTVARERLLFCIALLRRRCFTIPRTVCFRSPTVRARSRPWTFRIRHWDREASASPQTAAVAPAIARS